jgi:hypothetical protein
VYQSGPEMERAMNRADDRRITVIVPKDIHLSLKLEAVKQETTVSDIVRGLIEGWLAGVQRESLPVDTVPSGQYHA